MFFYTLILETIVSTAFSAVSPNRVSTSTRFRYRSSHWKLPLSRIQSLSRLYFPPRALIFLRRGTSSEDLKQMFRDKRNPMILGVAGLAEIMGITRMFLLSFRPRPI